VKTAAEKSTASTKQVKSKHTTTLPAQTHKCNGPCPLTGVTVRTRENFLKSLELSHESDAGENSFVSLGGTSAFPQQHWRADVLWRRGERTRGRRERAHILQLIGTAQASSETRDAVSEANAMRHESVPDVAEFHIMTA